MIPSVDVYLSAGESSRDVIVGRARFNLRRGRISTSFIYDERYLHASDAFSIDPQLPLQASACYTDGLPGAFRDSAPDRWGRHLIARRLRSELPGGGMLRSLDDVDYLLGVHDDARQGALRYSVPGSNDYLASAVGVPPRIELPRLLAASNRIATEMEDADDIKALLEAGSASLGGARPKASVVDGERLLLAKFSHPQDRWHVMRWERFALLAAQRAGLSVPASRLVSIDDDDVLLLQRFDRKDGMICGPRLPYMSAMTLVGANDGDDCDYVDVAEALVDVVGDADRALRDLFARVVFSVAIHNTDDHLRNIGFIREGGEWRLAPCFDINPNPVGSESRATGVYGECGRDEVEGLAALAPICGISNDEANRCVAHVLAAFREWRATASRAGCSASEQELFASVFSDRCSALAARFPQG